MEPSIKSNDVLVYSAFRPAPINLYHVKEGLSTPLTQSTELQYKAVVSNDGQWLIFTSEESGTPALYARSLHNPSTPAHRLLNGHFMEDAATLHGETLYFVSTRDGVADLYSVPFNPLTQTDIATAQNLTKGKGSSFNPSISPDGKWIAFCNNSHEKSPLYFGPIPPANFKAGNIYIMSTDGTQMKRVSYNDDWDGSPVWSQDGKNIYFYSMQSGKPRLYEADFASLQVQPVKELSHLEILSPTFTPEGRLAFVEQRGENTLIASVDLKKQGLDYRLESDTQRDYMEPVIHPTGGFIAQGVGEIVQPQFGGERPPSAKKPMGTGPFLVKKMVKELADGKPITVMAVRGYFPVVHPSGNHILAYEDFGKIYQVDSEGKNPKCIFSVPEKDMGYGLNFSPDGKWFTTVIGQAFSPARTPGHIYKFDCRDFKATDLTPKTKDNNSFPVVGKDSSILFTSTRSGHKNLFSMREDGSQVEQITFTQGTDAMPTISPKGNKIVFVSQRNGKNYNLYMLKKDKVNGGWKEIQLSDSVESHAHPNFSPDGKKIVFSSGRAGLNDETPLIPIFNPQPYGDIYVMTLKNRKIERITANKWEDSLPHWG